MLLSRRDYAKHRGVAVSTVQEAIDSGRITLVDEKIDPVLADKQWAENTNPAYHSGGEKSDNNSKYRASRTMRETYDALLKKQEYESRSGELLKRTEVEMDIFNAARVSRDQLLSLPDQIMHKFLNRSDLKEMTKELREEIRKKLVDTSKVLRGDKS